MNKMPEYDMNVLDLARRYNEDVALTASGHKFALNMKITYLAILLLFKLKIVSASSEIHSHYTIFVVVKWFIGYKI